jgi:hypothetical protein
MNARRLYPWALGLTLPAAVGILDPLFPHVSWLRIPEVRDLLNFVYTLGLVLAPFGIPLALGVALFGRDLRPARRLAVLVITACAAFGCWWALRQLMIFARWRDI